MKPRKRQSKPKEPAFPEFMLEVNEKNRSKLESDLGYELPKDVTYIIDVDELYSDEFLWAAEPTVRNETNERYTDIERIDYRYTLR